MENKKTLTYSSRLVAIVAIAMVAMLVIPLPTVLLDILIAFNLLLSLLVLLFALMQHPLPLAGQVLSLPTIVLLISTFGVALNIATTRQMLSLRTQFDSRIIRSLTHLVIDTHETVGLVTSLIFVVFIAVLALIFAKGAKRLAEAAARFALDSIPAQYCTLEEKYNSGAITDEETPKNKLQIQREADFYGSMDGAARFISTTVKLIVFISFVNLAAGLVLGMVLHNEAFSDTLKTYAPLAAVSGILFELSALLVALGAGLIVARLSSKEKT